MKEKLRSFSPVMVPRMDMYPPLRPYHNVDIYCSRYGGQPLCGWAVWWRPGIVVEAIPHCVVADRDGALLDVTSGPITAAGRTVFLRASSSPYRRQPNLSYPITLVSEFINLIEDQRLQVIESAYFNWKQLTFDLQSQLQKSGCTWSPESGWRGQVTLDAHYLSAAVQEAQALWESLVEEYVVEEVA